MLIRSPSVKALKLSVGLACATVALAVSYLAALVSFSDEPRGCFASWGIYPHSMDDLIEFKQGNVRHLTCCGDSSWGSYSRRSDGVWIWQVTETHRYRLTPDGTEHPFWEAPPGSVDRVRTATHEVKVHPAPFTVELHCETNSNYNRVLRRRLTRYHPF